MCSLLYGCQIEVFDLKTLQSVNEICCLAQYPFQGMLKFGMFADRKGRLWVANSSLNNISVWPRGASTPSMILDDPGETPLDVVRGHDGVVYASNQSGSISVYARGATSPTSTLSDPQFAAVGGVTLDSGNNLYVVVTGSRGCNIDRYPARSTTPTQLGICSDVGVGFDATGNTVTTSGGQVVIYPPGGTQPTNKFGHMISPAYFAFGTLRNNLFVVDVGQFPSLGIGTINEYTYPGGALVNTITFAPALCNKFGCATDGVAVALPAPL
jgi:hypothetical protein